MSSTPERFTRKPEAVEAVQVTADNMAEVAAWCGGEVRGRGAQRRIAVTFIAAYLGDWVVRSFPDKDGWTVASDRTFAALWQPEPIPSTAQVTEYRLSLLPDDDLDSQAFEVKVAYRGRDLWAVTRHTLCLASDGTWDYEPSPSNREDDWLVTHRFPLDEALRLADAALPSIKVNGTTAADVLAERGVTP
jgi:hypothetical protein